MMCSSRVACLAAAVVFVGFFRAVEPGIAATVADLPEKPNVVVIFCDDLGYGDLGCYGHPTIVTPHLDRMAAEGTRLTEFYVAAPVCTPSRAALITGRLPQRSGMCSDNRRVLFPESAGGLPADEITIAEKMKEAGYATGMFGKWHLGHLPPYLPTEHGFDEYFGIPYSNDMDKTAAAPRGRAAFTPPKIEYFNVPLLDGTAGQPVEEVERPAEQRTITQRYTYRAVDFIRKNREQPFFVYLPHSMPHVPLFRSDAFTDHSLRGLYGDVIEELDWSVGQILDELRKNDLEEKTLVVFTSDNGPWLSFDVQGGSAGLLRQGKGTTFEGGMRVPGIFWWPGIIPAGVTRTGLASTLDLLPTCCRLAGVDAPQDRTLDGYDLTEMLVEGRPSPRKEMFFYRGYRLMAVRNGLFKAHFITEGSYGSEPRQAQQHDPPLLYHLGEDPGEQWNIAADYPDQLEGIQQLVEQHRANADFAPSQLEARIGKP